MLDLLPGLFSDPSAGGQFPGLLPTLSAGPWHSNLDLSDCGFGLNTMKI